MQIGCFSFQLSMHVRITISGFSARSLKHKFYFIIIYMYLYDALFFISQPHGEHFFGQAIKYYVTKLRLLPGA
jgi:hypothetical protein